MRGNPRRSGPSFRVKFSVLQTEPDTYADSVDPNETAHHECLPSDVGFRLAYPKSMMEKSIS